MATTTIAVEISVRNELAAQATEHGRTLGEEVAALLRERETREILAVGARIIADPQNAELINASIAPAVRWSSTPSAEVDE